MVLIINYIFFINYIIIIIILFYYYYYYCCVVEIIIYFYYSLPFEGVGVKFIRIFKTNNCQLVYYKDVLELFQVVE